MKLNFKLTLIVKIMNEYINLICYDRNVTVEAVKRRRGDQNTAQTRHLIAYCLYNFKGITSKEVGKLLGNRHHSTILNSINKVNENNDLYSYCANLNLDKLEFDEYIDCKLGNIIMIKS
jgi:chromosomal replication initiation ATPase DnaA